MTDTDSDSGRADADDRTAAAFETSRSVRVVRRLVGEGGDDSAVVQRAVRTVTRSFVYRWLTKEPDPEVIVIDLRETYTVGPFIRLVDGVVDATMPSWQHSRVKDTLDRLGGWVEPVAESEVGKRLGAVFAPPEPPDEKQGDGRDGSGDD